MISQAELENLLNNLCRDQLVNLGVGDAVNRGWFRAQVVAHEAATGRLVLTYVMDQAYTSGRRDLLAEFRRDDEVRRLIDSGLVELRRPGHGKS